VGGSEDLATVAMVREVHHGPDDGGGQLEKKISVDGGGGRGFAIHWCGDDGQADRESMVWTCVTPHVSNPYDYVSHMFKRP
jgi:hypothetical protein